MIHNAIEEEQACLGACMTDKDALFTVLEKLTTSCFYEKKHRLIFDAIIELNSKSIDIDYLTLTEQLEKDNVLEECGNVFYITELADNIPSTANVSEYCDIVLNKALLRSEQVFVTKIEKKIDESKDGKEVLGFAQQKIIDLGQDKVKSSIIKVGNVLPDVLDNLEKSKEGISGLETGIKKLDYLIGGLQKEKYILIAGRPSLGKTALMLKFARTIGIKNNLPVGIISLEMGATGLAQRILLSESRVDGQHANSGRLTDSDFVKISNNVGKIADAPIYIDDTPKTEVTLRVAAQRMKMQYDIQALLLDYLQLCKLQGRYETRNLEIKAVSNTLNDLKKELKIPIIPLSQLSRKVEERRNKRPILADLREGGDIEQDADIVLFPYRPAVYDECDETGNIDESVAEIGVAKQRDGAIGTVEAVWDAKYMDFYDKDIYHEEPNEYYREEKVF